MAKPSVGYSLRPKRSFSKSSAIVASALLAVGGTALLIRAHATSFDCFGQTANYTITAPATVTAGSTFSVSGITGSSNTLGTTVTSSTLAVTVSGATPTAFSKTWTGSASGSFVADYGNQQLQATGAVGSSITIKADSVTSQVTGIGTVSCSVANNQLTAGKAGESLTLVTINVVAPAAASSSSKSAAVTTTHTAQLAPTPTAGTPAPTTATTPTADQSATTSITSSSGYDLTIKVVDSGNKLLVGAKVTIDNLPPATTNSVGAAQFSHVSAGLHSVNVVASGKTANQQVTVANKVTELPQQFQVKVAAIHSTSPLPFIALGVLVALIIIIALVGRYFMRRHYSQKQAAIVDPPSAPPVTTPPPAIYPSQPIAPASPPPVPPTQTPPPSPPPAPQNPVDPNPPV